MPGKNGIRYGYWMPVFGGWLRNVDDEHMQATWEYTSKLARRSEQIGFDLSLIAELNMNDIKGIDAPSLDAWSTSAALAAVTNTLELMVAVRPTFHLPALLAKQAANIDHISGGRISLNVVSSWWAEEARKYGVHFDEHDDRYARTAEVMSIVRRIWSEDAPFDFDGQFFRYEGAFSSVKPATPGGIPLYFAGASPPAIAVGAAQADVYAFWGEPRAAVAARMETIGEAAAKVGRTLRYSISLRPIIADTEQEAWEKAEWIASETAQRIELARQRMSGSKETYRGLGGAKNATFSVDRNTGGTTSVGRQRLIEMSSDQDVYDERLWMKVANLTGAAGNSTALVGTPEQVAEAMLRYYDLGITTLLLKGFDPLADAVEFGEKLLPLVREGAELRDAAGVH